MSLMEAWRRRFVAALHALAGVSDYERFVRHLKTKHPGAVIPSRGEFFRSRQSARFAKGARPPCC